MISVRLLLTELNHFKYQHVPHQNALVITFSYFSRFALLTYCHFIACNLREISFCLHYFGISERKLHQKLQLSTFNNIVLYFQLNILVVFCDFLFQSYLESFSKFCDNLGGTNQEVMRLILQVSIYCRKYPVQI